MPKISKQETETPLQVGLLSLHHFYCNHCTSVHSLMLKQTVDLGSLLVLNLQNQYPGSRCKEDSELHAAMSYLKKLKILVAIDFVW